MATGAWTARLVREWAPVIGVASALRLRSELVAASRSGERCDLSFSVKLPQPVGSRAVLRRVDADIAALREVFVDEVYGAVHKRVRQCRSVVDLGANIGLAALYFAGRFPACSVFAIEPDRRSYGLLVHNTARLASEGRCRVALAAFWTSRARVVADGGGDLSFCGRTARLAARDVVDPEAVSGLPMLEIIERAGFATVDLLKVDIEGAEAGMFAADTAWLDRVNAIAIEFHGMSRAVSGFDSAMAAHGFRVTDEGGHTTVAVRSTAARR